MTKQDLLKEIKKCQELQPAKRNIMGCNESWYDYVFAIKETFTLEEIEKMSQIEIDNLIRLASNIQDGLY